MITMIRRKAFTGKKGFLFTFITIFLLFSLLLLTYNYMQRNKQSQEFLSEISYSTRMNFVRENIVSDYFDMLDVDLDKIERKNGNIILRFNNFSTISPNSVYPQYLLRQENFTEGYYANYSNVGLILEGFAPRFYLYPYNTTFVIDNLQNPDEFFIYFVDSNRLNSFHIDLTLNTSIVDLNQTSEPTDDGGGHPYVWIRVFDKDDNLLLNSTTQLNMQTVNEDYIVAFDKITRTVTLPTWTIEFRQNITMEFGEYRQENIFGQDVITRNTFHLKSSEIDVDIEAIEINYTETNKKAVLKTTGLLFLS
jgi:hypothetical protein